MCKCINSNVYVFSLFTRTYVRSKRDMINKRNQRSSQKYEESCPTCEYIDNSYLSQSKWTCEPPCHTHEQMRHKNILERVFHVRVHHPLNIHVCVNTYINSTIYVLFHYTSIFGWVQYNVIRKSMYHVTLYHVTHMRDSYHTQKWINKSICLYI